MFMIAKHYAILGAISQNAEHSGSVKGLLPSVAGLCFMRDYSRLKRLKIAISNENSHD